MINFNTSKRDAELITEIAKLASAKAHQLGVEYTRLDATMDLTACHANGCPLDLERLLEAGVGTTHDGDFAHDVFGIRRHIDRETGVLLNCFVPRFARRYTAAEAR